MEKYIIILVILATIYYIQTQLNNIEGFADAPQTIGGVDDANAINTLAQIAKNLMTGGFTIPGSINLTNNKTKFTLVNDADNDECNDDDDDDDIFFFLNISLCLVYSHLPP